jgi:hypothetical protein
MIDRERKSCMYEIAKPGLLDPDRPLHDLGPRLTLDDRPDTELLAGALRESCEYAGQLWENLNAMRQYLLDSLPPDPRQPGPHTTAGASPTGPDDDTGWNDWVAAFAAITSALCGPHGDSGFGLSRAKEEAQLRRSAPVLRIHADRPDRARQPDKREEASSAATGASRPDPDGDEPHPAPVRSRRPNSSWTPGKTAAVLGLAAITLRQLRPRRDRSAT